MRQAERSDPERGAGAATFDRANSEHIYLRNYDQEWGYDVTIEVYTDEEEKVFEGRYYLPPGGVKGEPEVLPSGIYQLRVTLNDDQVVSRRCRLGSTPGRTAVVEVGNGAVSLTDGLLR